MKDIGFDERHGDAGETPKQERADTLVRRLSAFEKISAVEGIALSPDMRRDLEIVSGGTLSETERTDFIIGKYGRR